MYKAGVRLRSFETPEISSFPENLFEFPGFEIEISNWAAFSITVVIRDKKDVATVTYLDISLPLYIDYEKKEFYWKIPEEVFYQKLRTVIEIAIETNLQTRTFLRR